MYSKQQEETKNNFTGNELETRQQISCQILPSCEETWNRLRSEKKKKLIQYLNKTKRNTKLIPTKKRETPKELEFQQGFEKA